MSAIANRCLPVHLVHVLLTAVVMISSGQSAWGNGVEFHVTLDEGFSSRPITGRLVVYLNRVGSGIPQEREPADGPFLTDPQPMFGIDVDGLAPGATVIIKDECTYFPHPPSALLPGSYLAQAVLDRSRLNSRWKREPGNLYSTVEEFQWGGSLNTTRIELLLGTAVEETEFPSHPRVDWFEHQSRLLSEFHGRPVKMRAGLIKPVSTVENGKHAAVYLVPGFGGDHMLAYWVARMCEQQESGSPPAHLMDHTYHVVLDPEGPLGHHLFADSANNGPVEKALIEEFIPALEAKYPLLSDARARLLRGHSSGAWSALWLSINHPEVFGGAWATAPDPVDFRRFQKTNIYRDEKFFVDPATEKDYPSYRSNSRVTMTVRQENQMEQVIDPRNRSGQQWDAWQAVFGSHSENGSPAALFDPSTGKINSVEADRYRKYDIAARVRNFPEPMRKIFNERIRLAVGDRDNFFLNEAVMLLKHAVDGTVDPEESSPKKGPGYIKVVPGEDHFSIRASSVAQAVFTEMVAHLRQFDMIPELKVETP
ncbi:MAG: alpha/beta hydrolase-fold protein [Planctomycetota bacterium]|jgi:hypothetical protein